MDIWASSPKMGSFWGPGRAGAGRGPGDFTKKKNPGWIKQNAVV